MDLPQWTVFSFIAQTFVCMNCLFLFGLGVFYIFFFPTLIPLSGVGTTYFSSFCDKDSAFILKTIRLLHVYPPWNLVFSM
jgi:hypothetical protein